MTAASVTIGLQVIVFYCNFAVALRSLPAGCS